MTGPQGDYRPPRGIGSQPVPMNAPPAQPLSVGVQPGTPNIIRAFIVIISGGAGSGLFVYSPTVGAGNLILSVAGQPGTDPYGNAYLGNGLAVYGSGFTEFLGLIGGVPELQFRTGLSNESTPANLAGGVVGLGAAETMQLLMSGPKGAAVGGQDWAQVYLISNNSGVTAPAQGQLRFIDTNGVVTNPLIWGVNGVSISNDATPPGANSTGTQLYGSSGLSSHLKYVAFDGNQYNTGRDTLFTSGTQIVNSASDAVITGLSAPVGTGTYWVQGIVTYRGNQAGGVPTFTFHGPAVSAANSNVWYTVQNAGATSPLPQFNNSALPSFAGPTLVNAQFVSFSFDCLFTFSAPGTLSLQANTSVPADTFTTQALSRMNLMPAA